MEIDPPSDTLHVYNPACDSSTSYRVTLLQGSSSHSKSAGSKLSAGPSQSYTGVPATSLGRETEQVRVTLCPASTKYEGVAYREMLACSVEELDVQLCKNMGATDQ